jgi:hypothetical protein
VLYPITQWPAPLHMRPARHTSLHACCVPPPLQHTHTHTLVQVAEAEAAFLQQLNSVATEAATVQALFDAVVPQDVAQWQLTADIQQLRKESHGLARTLRSQKEVRPSMLAPCVVRT